MKDSEIAGKAIEVLRERGWCRFTLEDTEGRVCLGGAVVTVLGNNRNNRTTASQFIDRMTVWMGFSAIGWNDHNARDVDAVIEKLKLFGEYRAGKGD